MSAFAWTKDEADSILPSNLAGEVRAIEKARLALDDVIRTADLPKELSDAIFHLSVATQSLSGYAMRAEERLAALEAKA